MTKNDYEVKSDLTRTLCAFIGQNQLLSGKLTDVVNDDQALSNEQATELLPAIEKGFLTIINQRPSFTSNQATAFFSAARTLVDISVNGFDGIKLPRGKYNSELLIILKNVQGFSVKSLLEGEGSTFWETYHAFCNALIYLNLTVDELIECLLIVQEKTKNDFSAGKMYDSLKLLGELQPDLAKLTIQQIVEKRTDNVVTYVPTLFEGRSKSIDSNHVFFEVLELTQSDVPELHRIGILTSSTIDHSNTTESIELIKKVMQLLDSTRESCKVEMLPAVVQAYGNMIPKDGSSKESIALISKTNDPQTLYAISHVLWRFNYASDRLWYWTILEELSKVIPEHKATIQNIYYSLLDRLNDDPHIIVDFFNRWVTFEHNMPESIRPFDYLLQKLYQDQQHLFSKLITNWLLDPRFIPQLIVAAILRDLHVHKMNEIRLDRELVGGLSNEQCTILVARILGFVINREHLQTMVYSILENSAQSEEVQEVIVRAFADYIVYNYPSSLDFLKMKQKKASFYEKKVIRNIIDDWNKYIKPLNTLTQLNELKPSETRLRAYYKLQSKRFGADFNKSDEHSILSLARKIDVKSESLFTRTEEGYSEKSTLGRIEASTEMPRGEFIDPIGQARSRYHWKTVARL